MAFFAMSNFDFSHVIFSCQFFDANFFVNLLIFSPLAVFPSVPELELELFKSGTGTFRIHFGTGTF
jgi:hypothetical protein